MEEVLSLDKSSEWLRKPLCSFFLKLEMKTQAYLQVSKICEN